MKHEVRILESRDCKGRYDRVLSCEMVEAVGHENLPVYFWQISALLRPHGVAVIQAGFVTLLTYNL